MKEIKMERDEGGKRKIHLINSPVQPCNTNKPKRSAKESWRNNFYAPTVDEPPLLSRSRQQHRTRYLDENNVT